MAKIISPKWRITAADIPSVWRSALISAGGVLFAIGVYLLVKWLLPEQDFSGIEVAIATAVGAWLVNLVKIFVSEK